MIARVAVRALMSSMLDGLQLNKTVIIILITFEKVDRLETLQDSLEGELGEDLGKNYVRSAKFEVEGKPQEHSI